jgi:type VI secretion system protein ImpH
MGATDRDPSTAIDVLRQLEQHPFAADLFGVLRLIEAQHPDQPRLGHSRKVDDDPVRLHQQPTLAFPPSSLAALEVSGSLGNTHLYQYVMGVFGPNGPLPLHLTEYAYERLVHAKDPTFARFVDIFHQRLIQLFFRAWADSQPVSHADRPAEDRFSSYVDSAIGFNAEAFSEVSPSLRRSARHQAVHLVGLTRTAEGLRKHLAAVVEARVEVEPIKPRWHRLEDSERLRLSRQDPRPLGQSTILGATVCLPQAAVDIRLYDLSIATYDEILVDSPLRRLIVEAILLYVGSTIGWRVFLHLKRGKVPSTVLGHGEKLGQTSWLGKVEAGRGDYCFRDVDTQSH